MSAFYKMDPAAWDFGTTALSLEEEAAYLRIVNAIHKHDAPVPDNDRVLAGMFRCSTRKARSLLEGLIKAGKVRIENGCITNDRAVSDMVQRGFISSSRAESGAKGGRSKAKRASNLLENNDQAVAIASPRIEESRIEKNIPTSGELTLLPPDEPEEADPISQHFDRFWQEYPLKKSRKNAEKNFRREVKNGADPEKIIQGARGYAASVRGTDPSKIKYPEGWLSANRWEDYQSQSGQPGYSDFIARQAEKDRLARENYLKAEREHQERMEKARRLQLAQREAQA